MRFYSISQARHVWRPLRHEACHHHVDEASQLGGVGIVCCRFETRVLAPRAEDVRAQRNRDMHVCAVERCLRGHRVRDKVLGRAEVANVNGPRLLMICYAEGFEVDSPSWSLPPDEAAISTPLSVYGISLRCCTERWPKTVNPPGKIEASPSMCARLS